MASVQLDWNCSFNLLIALPPELLCKILSDFCDGKALSTAALALAPAANAAGTVISSPASPENCDGILSLWPIAWHLIPSICQEKLRRIASVINRHVDKSDDDKNLREAEEWIKSIADVPVSNINSDAVEDRCKRMRLLSENLAVLDFLQRSLNVYSDVAKGQFAWPIWVGQLTIDSFLTGTRMRNTARVVITAPLQGPCLIPGGSLLRHHRTPTGTFRCEPYNFVAVPPWGRIHGLQAEDNRTLQPIAARLEESGEVAVPTGYCNPEVLNLRIISRKQARAQSFLRLSSSKTSWMLEGKDEETPLFCCWHDDSMDPENDRDYIAYVIDLMKTRKRLQPQRFE